MRRLLAGLAITVATIASLSFHATAEGYGKGGKHNHATTRSDSKTRKERKTTKAIEHLLSSEETRRALVEAVVGDRFTMNLLLGRIAMDPVWAKEAAEVLVATLPEAPVGPAVTQPKGDPGTTTTMSYSCPMHPEVAADHPDKCSRCGMDLVAQTWPQARP